MSSTSYNVGVGDLKRPTSKVLAPPGGETSIAFGHRNSNANDSSSMKSALHEDVCPPKPAVASAPTGDAAAAPAAPTRARVPPGGFSSGLW